MLLIIPLLPLLGSFLFGAAVGAGGTLVVGGIIALLSDDDVKKEATNHTGGLNLNSTFTEIKRIYKEKGKGYYNIGLEQHMSYNNKLIDAWSMNAESVGNMYEGKRLYYD